MSFPPTLSLRGPFRLFALASFSWASSICSILSLFARCMRINCPTSRHSLTALRVVFSASIFALPPASLGSRFFACCAAKALALSALAGHACLFWWLWWCVAWRVDNACRVAATAVTSSWSSGVGTRRAGAWGVLGCQLAAPSSWGVATATRLYECLASRARRLLVAAARARSALVGRDARPVWQALPGFAKESTRSLPVAHLSRRRRLPSAVPR